MNILRILAKLKITKDIEGYSELSEIFNITDEEVNEWCTNNHATLLKFIREEEVPLKVPENMVSELIDYSKSVISRFSKEEHRHIKCLELKTPPKELVGILLLKLNYITHGFYPDFSYYNIIKLYMDFDEGLEDLKLILDDILREVS